jgi:hypothetical protein
VQCQQLSELPIIKVNNGLARRLCVYLTVYLKVSGIASMSVPTYPSWISMASSPSHHLAIFWLLLLGNDCAASSRGHSRLRPVCMPVATTGDMHVMYVGPSAHR